MQLHSDGAHKYNELYELSTTCHAPMYMYGRHFPLLRVYYIESLIIFSRLVMNRLKLQYLEHSCTAARILGLHAQEWDLTYLKPLRKGLSECFGPRPRVWGAHAN